MDPALLLALLTKGGPTGIVIAVALMLGFAIFRGYLSPRSTVDALNRVINAKDAQLSDTQAQRDKALDLLTARTQAFDEALALIKDLNQNQKPYDGRDRRK